MPRPLSEFTFYRLGLAKCPPVAASFDNVRPKTSLSLILDLKKSSQRLFDPKEGPARLRQPFLGLPMKRPTVGRPLDLCLAPSFVAINTCFRLLAFRDLRLSFRPPFRLVPLAEPSLRPRPRYNLVPLGRHRSQTPTPKSPLLAARVAPSLPTLIIQPSSLRTCMALIETPNKTAF